VHANCGLPLFSTQQEWGEESRGKPGGWARPSLSVSVPRIERRDNLTFDLRLRGNGKSEIGGVGKCGGPGG
jgi:hypothetical protein